MKKKQEPWNKGKKYKDLGVELKPRGVLSKMTIEDKERFMKMCENNDIKKVAANFKMKLGHACQLQRDLTDGYVRSLRNHKRKLTKYQVIKILIETMRGEVKQKDLAIKYNVSACNISNICAGRSWKHVFQGVQKKYNSELLSIKNN